MQETQPHKSSHPRRKQQSDLMLKGLTAAFILAAVITAILVFNYVRGFTATWNITELEGLALKGAPASEGGNPSVDNPLPVQDIQNLPTDPWDGASRVTILVMGLDARDWEQGVSYPKTDSMMLLTFDPATQTAGILSLPRDLWVNIPGFGYGKINTAYQNAEAAKLPGGGPELAMRTVEEFLGVKIDYYAQIDFNTFVKFVDFIEGVEVTPTEKLTLQDVIGTDKSFRLKKDEKVVLWGQEALAYVRYRHSGGGDFDRAQRQQQVLLAIRTKLLEPHWQQKILANAPEMYALFQEGIKTNLSFDEIFKLGLMVKDIDFEDIKRGAITPPDMVTLAVSPDGLDILKPITQNIRILRDEIFSSGGIISPGAVGADLTTLIQAEAATVAVYNGTNTAGLAGTTQTYLQSQGVNVVTVDNGNITPYTVIYVYTSKPYTMQFLVELMKIQPNYIYFVNDPTKGVDIEIILGSDWQVPLE